MVLRSYGLGEFYRGLLPILIRNGASNGLFFAFRDPIRDAVLGLRTGQGEHSELETFWADFASGAVLGAALSTLFFPINVTKVPDFLFAHFGVLLDWRVQVRLQSELGGPFAGIWTTLGVLWGERNRSLKDFYLGGRINYTRFLMRDPRCGDKGDGDSGLRSLLSWGITNSVYGLLKRHYFHPPSSQ